MTVRTRRAFDTGGYSPSETHYTIRDRLWVPGNRNRLVVVCHGHGGSAIDATPSLAFPALTDLFTELAGDRAVVFVPDGGGTAQWGNATAVAAYHAAIAYAHSVSGTSGPATIVGISMGMAAACNLAKTWPGDVGRIIGIVPVSDLGDVVTNDRGGNAASVNAAYGGSYASNGTATNPLALAPSLTVPLQIWYGSADVVCVPSTVTALLAAWGGTTQATLVAGGTHGNSTYNAIDRESLRAFAAA